MLTALYNSQDKVMRITSGPTMVRDHGGVRWNKTTGYRTKRGRAGCTREETMYEVEWSPSIICENHINSYLNNLNYKPKSYRDEPDQHHGPGSYAIIPPESRVGTQIRTTVQPHMATIMGKYIQYLLTPKGYRGS